MKKKDLIEKLTREICIERTCSKMDIKNKIKKIAKEISIKRNLTNEILIVEIVVTEILNKYELKELND